MTPKQAMDQALFLRYLAGTGQMDYEEAKIKAEPLLAEVNEASKAIAKKYNRSPQKMTFATLPMRSPK